MNAFFEGDATESEEPVQEEENLVQLNGLLRLLELQRSPAEEGGGYFWGKWREATVEKVTVSMYRQGTKKKKKKMGVVVAGTAPILWDFIL